MSDIVLPPTSPAKTSGLLESLSNLAARTTPLLIITMLSVAASLIMFFTLLALRSEPPEVRVAFVKLHPNGSYHISYNDTEQPFSLFQSTIDSLLRKALIARFSENPRTVQSDYNTAALFMGSSELGRFMREFDAPAQIRRIQECVGCPIIEPKIQALQHMEYLSNAGIDTLAQGRIVRSTAYISLEHRNRTSGDLIRAESKIVPIEWHLDPTKIRAIGNADDVSIAILNVNPIGLTILSYTVQDDRSAAG